ncbi:NGG1p interacting factor 3 protein, NIF3 [Candidatus Endoriftia persephone str. Guaymas]|jgi:hypothetical protein|uniref:NGG1p interacting factor NIF3 n=2 Tax=Gammaproteobacteria TaxID=1236 RepID=G2FJ12_9GAMM|nr:NIF3 1 [Candidatus Endoriftia persephone]EGW53214.1 hypothetical protein TevJSym_bi00180 [endosymbiont of Tevnia jerichonana (vent Tica)]MBA1333324.1 NGG1p interacting factor 3 protein, NIF3 [Candidatus Endoriftia persephone str. Guaymas]USF87151.1 NGG1p interacting factor NIF3 [Candidatus Endoriftia persephone]
MYLLAFYVPESHLESLKQALFDKGAGRLAGYDRCAWETEGRGQFRPLAGSRPFIGETGRTEQLIEYKVEMICAEERIKAVIDELLRTHPYEQPAYHVIQMAGF